MKDFLKKIKYNRSIIKLKHLLINKCDSVEQPFYDSDCTSWFIYDKYDIIFKSEVYLSGQCTFTIVMYNIRKCIMFDVFDDKTLIDVIDDVYNTNNYKLIII